MKTRTRVARQWIAGLDISLNGAGLCVVAGDPKERVGPRLFVDSALVSLGKDLRGPERLSVVTNAIWAWLCSKGLGKPGNLYVVENYAFSATHAHGMGEIGGCVRKVIWESGGNLIAVPPASLKKFLTGSGAGMKNVVVKHVFKRWNFDVDDDNQCDAFGCAILGLLDTRPESCLATETDLLNKKVMRYAGKGSCWKGTEEVQKRRSGGR